ncbi:hypothetical protein HK415_12795 [Ramlibacter sp. B156]|uniref:Uncharacterized protein n=1 Tax=Ramlibacter montanisoli TaxID=2732512 RepID=A0A849KGQ5_9BURK|nr:hypothetical protein [Ramlibacter montanisoli]
MVVAIVPMARARAMLDGVRMGLQAGDGDGRLHGAGRHGVPHPAAQGQQQDDEEQEPAVHRGQ